MSTHSQPRNSQEILQCLKNVKFFLVMIPTFGWFQTRNKEGNQERNVHKMSNVRYTKSEPVAVLFSRNEAWKEKKR